MTAVTDFQSPAAVGRLPTLVSFFGGDKYYYDAAERLRSDCDALGWACDIREVSRSKGDDWADMCRKKINFYAEMLALHPNGILWVDVDTRIVGIPDMVRFGGYDFGAFLRNFHDLRTYDPFTFSRTFHPGFLHFAGTERVREFVAHMGQLEASADVRATDDYFLEEAFRTFPKAMGVGLFASDVVAKRAEDASAETCFIFGDSGNVRTFVGTVEQHKPSAFVTKRKQALLKTFSDAAVKKGDREEALTFLSRAFQLDPTNRSAAMDYAKVLFRIERYAAVLDVLKRAFGNNFSGLDAVKLAVDSNLALGRIEMAGKQLNKLDVSKSNEARAYVESRKYRLGLEARANALGKDVVRPVLWWMETPYPGNFGDILNPYIVEKLCGVPPVHAPAGQGILAIGSVIKFAKPGTIVWGTGTPRMTDKLDPAADYRAVRGPLTRELVLKSGGTAPEIYGDAAMLLPLIFQPRTEKKHKLGLIRHYTHANEPIRLEGVHEIDIMRIGDEGIEAFLDELYECEHIVSTSLHGLIVSHAYGIPTRWATFSQGAKQLPGDGTKFEDHYRAFGIKFSPPTDLSSVKVLTADFAAQCDEVVTGPVRSRDLLQAAPFDVNDRFLTIEGYAPDALKHAGRFRSPLEA